MVWRREIVYISSPEPHQVSEHAQRHCWRKYVMHIRVNIKYFCVYILSQSTAALRGDSPCTPRARANRCMVAFTAFCKSVVICMCSIYSCIDQYLSYRAYTEARPGGELLSHEISAPSARISTGKPSNPSVISANIVNEIGGERQK